MSPEKLALTAGPIKIWTARHSRTQHWTSNCRHFRISWPTSQIQPNYTTSYWNWWVWEQKKQGNPNSTVQDATCTMSLIWLHRGLLIHHWLLPFQLQLQSPRHRIICWAVGGPTFSPTARAVEIMGFGLFLEKRCTNQWATVWIGPMILECASFTLASSLISVRHLGHRSMATPCKVRWVGNRWWTLCTQPGKIAGTPNPTEQRRSKPKFRNSLQPDLCSRWSSWTNLTYFRK